MSRAVETIKNVAIWSPLAIGPYLGATALAEFSDRGYSPEQVQELTVDIAEIDAEIRADIGEENQCQLTIYNFLRASDEFPTERNAIRSALKRVCEEPKHYSDDTYRLIESHMQDMADIYDARASEMEKSSVDFEERLRYGFLGLAAGAVATYAVTGAATRYNNKKSAGAEQEVEA